MLLPLVNGFTLAEMDPESLWQSSRKKTSAERYVLVAVSVAMRVNLKERKRQ